MSIESIECGVAFQFTPKSLLEIWQKLHIFKNKRNATLTSWRLKSSNTRLVVQQLVQSKNIKCPAYWYILKETAPVYLKKCSYILLDDRYNWCKHRINITNKISVDGKQITLWLGLLASINDLDKWKSIPWLVITWTNDKLLSITPTGTHFDFIWNSHASTSLSRYSLKEASSTVTLS